MCRFASSTHHHNPEVVQALKDLEIADEFDLLHFKDRKNNNFTQLALKGQGKDSRFDRNSLISILNTFGKKANGESFNYQFSEIK